MTSEHPAYPSRVTVAELLHFVEWCEGIFTNLKAYHSLNRDEARDLGATGVERCRLLIGPLKAELEATAPKLVENEDVMYLRRLYNQ